MNISLVVAWPGATTRSSLTLDPVETQPNPDSRAASRPRNKGIKHGWSLKARWTIWVKSTSAHAPPCTFHASHFLHRLSCMHVTRLHSTPSVYNFCVRGLGVLPMCLGRWSPMMDCNSRLWARTGERGYKAIPKRRLLRGVQWEMERVKCTWKCKE